MIIICGRYSSVLIESFPFSLMSVVSFSLFVVESSPAGEMLSFLSGCISIWVRKSWFLLDSCSLLMWTMLVVCFDFAVVFVFHTWLLIEHHVMSVRYLNGNASP